MSKHTVSLNGIDTGKVGNNKRVKLSEEFPDPSEITTTSEYAKFKGITPQAAVAELNPTGNLVPILPTSEKANKFLLATPFGTFGKQDMEVVDGRIVPKSRPTGFAGKLASVLDAATFGFTDYDELGGGLLGTKEGITGYGKEFKGDYKLSKAIKDQLKKDVEAEKKGPYGDMDELVKANLEYAEGMIPLQRKLARQQAIDSTAMYAATEPLRQAFLNRAAEQGAQRGLRVRGALEAMPSNIQKIMSAKQEQQSLASLTEAERQRATATQQDAATRFAGLGMQRRFG
jgi:hypothetical protein